MTRRAATTVVLLSLFIVAAKRDRDWKTGTLIEEAEVKELAGTNGMATVGPGPAMHGENIVYATEIGYVIKGEGLGFMVKLRVLPPTLFSKARSKRPSVTVHGPIKYSYTEGRFFLQDEQGQEFELIVMKKEVLPPEAPAAAASAPAAPKP